MGSSPASRPRSLVETTEFDALIVDIRVPPGTDPEWIEAYQKRGQDIAGARLGVEFLRSVMRHPKALVHLEQPPVWLRPTSVAVFSVERRERLVDELEGLEIGHFLQKTAYISKSALLDTVEAVMRSDGPSTDGGREEG